LNLPNCLSLLRLVLAPFFFTFLISYEGGSYQHLQWARLIFSAAVLTDVLDGFIARFFHQQTELGRLLDPLADKTLLLSGFLGLLFVSALPNHPPLWVTVTVVFRDLIILGGILVIFFTCGTVRVRPNFLGKAATAAQMVTLISILMQWSHSVWLCYGTAFLSAASMLSYVVRDFGFLLSNAQSVRSLEKEA